MDEDIQKFVNLMGMTINGLIVDVMFNELDYHSNCWEVIQKFKNQFITDEIKKSLTDSAYITDFSEIELFSFEYNGESDSNEAVIIFKDQDNRLRQVTIFGDEIPGMISYWDKLPEIKKDLITDINCALEWVQSFEAQGTD